MIVSAIFVWVTVLASQRILAQFPSFPSMFRGGPYGAQQQQQDDTLLTCIGRSEQDSSAVIRLTIRPDTNSGALGDSPFGGSSFGGSPFGGSQFGGQGFGAFRPGGGVDRNTPQDWFVEGLITPGLLPIQGAYRAVVTEFGRRAEGCNAAALGPAIRSQYSLGLQNPQGFQGAFGRSPMGFGGGFPGFGGFPFQQQGAQEPEGVRRNPVLVSQGPTVYSGQLRGVSFNDVNGGGIALCSQVNQGQCVGVIPLCCAISRDQIPASEVVLTNQGPAIPSVQVQSFFSSGLVPATGGQQLGLAGQSGFGFPAQQGVAQGIGGAQNKFPSLF